MLLNEDDDSLFSSSSKPVEKPAEPIASKPALDLFDDKGDAAADSDLFSASKTKIKKPALKDTKTIDLFDDAAAEDENDALFGSVAKKNETAKSEARLPSGPTTVPGKVDDNKTDSKSTKDIFDNSSDEDIFAASKITTTKKPTATESLFDDDDDDDLFGTTKSRLGARDSEASGRPAAKKPVTRDLKKTAEKIGGDPLSMLQDD